VQPGRLCTTLLPFPAPKEAKAMEALIMLICFHRVMLSSGANSRECLPLSALQPKKELAQAGDMPAMARALAGAHLAWEI